MHKRDIWHPDAWIQNLSLLWLHKVPCRSANLILDFNPEDTQIRVIEAQNQTSVRLLIGKLFKFVNIVGKLIRAMPGT